MKWIKYFLLFLGLLIVIVIATNYMSSKPKKAKQNPYEYNIDEFKHIDSALISHKEVRRIKVEVGDYGGIAAYNDLIYFATGSSVKTITLEGKVVSEIEIDDNPYCIAVDESVIMIGFQRHTAAYTHSGQLLYKTEEVSDSSIFTSIAFLGKKHVVADAGKRIVYIYENENINSKIEGISGARNLHGFIIPSAKFDLAVNKNGELWVVNPGMHALQHYDEKGSLLDAWEKSAFQIEGFSGCCNPAHFTFLNDGRFVTSEKGMPRIKIYSSKGEFESVVAAPNQFAENGRACDIVAINETIVALDYDKQQIRIFDRNY
jgi:hypothetical protein